MPLKPNLIPARVRGIAMALDTNYGHRPDTMMRWFISAVMELWGFKPWDRIPDDARAKITTAIGEYDAALQRYPWADLLGDVYQALASQGARQSLGQFFTPDHVCRLISQMNYKTIPANRKELFRVSDPACGGGAMLLAFCNEVLERQGPEALQGVGVYACDLDAYCARMCAVQLLANCFSQQVELGEIVVLRGNSLSDERKEVIVHATSPTREPRQEPRYLELAA
ncbi:N-6 DNA methylase [Crenobacter sp. SG2305]|uniref:N-6 DNA methylase n=1 Tax=Crenobacter oryzisoli TaxID=3056844 RepID=UPI0025AA47D6|nr:N-6 DNA methylase [Crenobacter sp. SG2305]MDN0082366.1 N-6 DNA methylase [Crenobacter sp. SG2305]